MLRFAQDVTAPPEIIGQFYPKGTSEIVPLTGGLVNTTHRVRDKLGELTILQRLGTSSDPRSVEDYLVVAERLRGDQWEVAEPLQTQEGLFIATDDSGNHWRGYSHIDSDPVPEAPSILTLVQLGNLVGRMSVSLSMLDYSPKYSIPHFHDVNYTARRLVTSLPTLSPEHQDFCGQILTGIASEPPISGPQKVIHGDTKLSNALYRADLPFTLIDWDTVMLGSPMIDLADMLRSVTGVMRSNSTTFRSIDLLPIVKAYRLGAGIHDKSSDDLFQEAISATRLLSLALAANYMSDSQSNSYFRLDEDGFSSVAEHYRHRATQQWMNYLALKFM